MKNVKRIVLAGAFAMAALFAFGATSEKAEAGGCGIGFGGYHAPVVDVYHAPIHRPVVHRPVVHHAPIVHDCAYKVFFYDCGVLRCYGTFHSPYTAKRKALYLELHGYNSFVKKIIL